MELAKTHFGVDIKEDEDGECVVVQNSDHLYATPFEVVKDIEPQPINEFEKKMLEGTISVDELLEMEKNQEPIASTEEGKVYAMRLKVIALFNLKKHPLSNPSTFLQKDKREVMEEMARLRDENTIEVNIAKFNDICSTLLFSPGSDYTSYPMYNF
jgi:hypothetical protein